MINAYTYLSHDWLNNQIDNCIHFIHITEHSNDDLRKIYIRFMKKTFPEYREDYLHDMKICQEFAINNRSYIAYIICSYFHIISLTSCIFCCFCKSNY